MRSVHSIGYLLQHVSAILGKQSDQVLQEQLGIGLSQFKILRALQTTPQLKQSEIAEHLGQTEASISRQVKLMIDEGLLQVRVSPTDHRQHLTVPTHKGERFTEAALQVLGKYHAPNFADLTSKQQTQLAELLGILHRHVCPMEHPDPSEPRQYNQE